MPQPTRDRRSKPAQPPADVEEVRPRLDRLLRLMADQSQHPKVRALAAKAVAKLTHRKADTEAEAPRKFQQTKSRGGRPAILGRPMSPTERWRRWRAKATGETA